jgi:uncharacterized protein
MTLNPLKHYKRAIKFFLIGFILMNIVAFFHAYTFTHFTDRHVNKTKDAKLLSTVEKLKTLLFGIDNPKPKSSLLPCLPYETITIQSNKRLECWGIKADSSKGTVVFFHGFSGEKSSMLERADILNKLNYNTLLVDFMGSGGSEGNETTVGFKEAEEVKSCVEYLRQKGEKRIYLFGTSMGAAAVLKAENDYQMNTQGLILECPFGSMYATTCARFDRMNVPSFPMAGLLVFWGGVQNGFWAYSHNPVDYAKSVKCPVLLMYGKQDKTITEQDTRSIFSNLNNPLNELKVYPNAGHEDFLKQYRPEWARDVSDFIRKTL